MPPYAGKTTITTINSKLTSSEPLQKQQPQNEPIKGYKGFFGEYNTDLIWLNIISIGLFHVVALYGLFTFPYPQKINTIIWGVVMGGIAGFGITAGAHRYWCHRSYKAKIPLQIILAICFSAAGQNTIFDWVRDHRVHHKFSETEADPHNSNRGFFFAHVGWLLMRKHPEVLRRGRQLDMSDITEDPVVQFHHKYFKLLKFVFCFLLPTVVPVYCWEESWYYAVMSQCVARYLMSLHFTWLVNSAAHLYGNKPYDASINPRENLTVSIFAMGEGWHNYHHTFPWDYRAAELGKLNTTLFWLDLFAKIGWAYDLKSPSKELVKAVMDRRGEKAQHHQHHHEEVPPDTNDSLSL